VFITHYRNTLDVTTRRDYLVKSLDDHAISQRKIDMERWERSREKQKKKAKARLLARQAAGLPLQLPQFDSEDEAPKRGYRKLTCPGCGRTVWAPRQALQCAACAKADRAAHMREVRAKRHKVPDFGNCVECGEPLDAERRSRKYCSAACRQQAYRIRLT
jgi:hypothetical protein